MKKKYSNEDHDILSRCVVMIGSQCLSMIPIIHEDEELMTDLKNAMECFKNFSKKMQER